MDISNLRPVTLEDGREGWFHTWYTTSYLVARGVITDTGGQISYTQGIVELTTGEVVLVKPEDITFNDTEYLQVEIDTYDDEEEEDE